MEEEDKKNMKNNYVSISKWYTPRKKRVETLVISGTFTAEELYDAGQKIQKKIRVVNHQMVIGQPQDTPLPDSILGRIQD